MSVFAIGDTHLSFSSDKPMNVFKGWDDYVLRLQNKWQKLVKTEDTVIINGDISWGMTLSESEKDFEFLNGLNGTKILIKGNHDYWWNTLTKMNNYFQSKGFDTLKILNNNAYRIGDISVAGTRGWFFDAEKQGEDKIMARECARLQRSIDEAKKLGGETVVFLHYPPVSNVGDCEPILDVLLANGIKRCYYGHLHGGAAHIAVNGKKHGIDFRLVSADYLEFCPYSISLG
ncbi:MAG: metallophosphoesterase [Oscillospiraceae bacterium]|nr:metallophosphoesterase [Oscillospiraceae bacterium]